ncbi:MAG TPA: sigma factor-like helix-turn-helix DNA-binding protein [Candidatus Nanoarchaeia archaeon]|nr:sigma factor-like helix-turn-helix DNA-binding protein [Candidatus Nanoarchaeia archaeon]
MSEKNIKHITPSFNPKAVTKKLMGVLSDRGRDVVSSRYGLGNETRKMTLESIGKKYNITRERVRQIENHSIANIRKSKEYEKEIKVFAELKDHLKKLGGVMSEHDLLNQFTPDKSTQNHIHFLLVVGEEFKKHKEDDEFKAHWHIDHKLAERIHDTLRKIYSDLDDDDIVPESAIIDSFLQYIKDVSEEYKNEEVIKRWLWMSKSLDKNPLGEWGKSKSSNINARGVRDYAFLVIRKHGSPIHFREVARLITEVFNKKAHVATTHNELIKDPRFVLVGRGLYALAEWGYMSGVVKDVIKKILEKEGPLTKEKIIEKVLKERYVKPNTILVNLQNSKFFKKDKQGRYSIA